MRINMLLIVIIIIADQAIISTGWAHTWRCGPNVFTVFKVLVDYRFSEINGSNSLIQVSLYYYAQLICSYLDKNDAVTPSALQQCLRSSYTPSPKVIDLFEVWDAKQGLSQYIDDIRYHTQPHHFRFLLVNGRVEMKYKHWCEDEVWQPLDEDEDDKEDDSDDESGKSNQLYILKESYVPLTSLPLVSPKLDSLNLEQLMADLSKLPSDYLSDANKREWEEFTRKLSSSAVAACTNKSLPELSFVDERGQRPTVSVSSAGAQLPHSITTLIEKENKRTPVSRSCALISCDFKLFSRSIKLVIHLFEDLGAL